MKSATLHYLSKERWTPLPQWGQFFLDIGHALSAREENGNRIVVGLALPTRAYAASLIAAGIVVGRASLSDQNEALERFQQLASLEIGTSLLYRKEGKRVKTLFQGVEKKGNRSWLKLDSGSEKYMVPPNLALQVEFPAKQFASPPKRSSRKTSTAISPFLANFLSQKTAKEAILRSHLDCLIIGSAGRLDREVNDISFAVMDTTGKFVEGKAQDIIRVRRFSQNEAYRSDVYYTHGRDFLERQAEMPSVVIFDGSTSFLKWKAYWSHPHCVVIFDQTERDFDAAIQVFNEEFIKNHLDEEVDLNLSLEIPKRLPLSIYQEVRK